MLDLNNKEWCFDTKPFIEFNKCMRTEDGHRCHNIASTSLLLRDNQGCEHTINACFAHSVDLLVVLGRLIGDGPLPEDAIFDS